MLAQLRKLKVEVTAIGRDAAGNARTVTGARTLKSNGR
jgi:hypothetical protein